MLRWTCPRTQLFETRKKPKNVENWHFSREIEVGQNNVNKIDNLSREIEVGQNNVNKSDNFSGEIEVCQDNVNKSLK